MRSWRPWFFGAVCWSACAAMAAAAVYSGVIETVAPDGTQFAITLANKPAKSFSLPKGATITVGGKKADATELAVGQSVAVTTDAQDKIVTKVTVRPAVVAQTAGAAKPVVTKAERTKATKKVALARNLDGIAASPGDWPQFRGPHRDNISTETGLLDRWPDAGPQLLWKISGLGEGFSSLSIVGDSIFTMGTQNNDELLIALDRDNGAVKWTRKTGQKRGDGMGGGPRGTPTVDGDRVYALGANGDLLCANRSTGEVVWQLNILKKFGGNNIGWGISESVLIDGDQLVCTPGNANTMVALDKLTGKPIWQSKIPGAPAAAYSSAVVAEIGGVRQYINFVHTGVVGVRAKDGLPLWGQPESANGIANCSAPLVTDDLVFTASGYGTGCALFQLSSGNQLTKSEVKYSLKQMKNHHGGMVLKDGYVYGFDEDILTCLDLRTGKPAWQNRSVGKGSLMMADNKLFLRAENNLVGLAAASPLDYEEFGRFEQPDRSQQSAWSYPVVVGGKLYLRDWDKLLVYDVKN